MLELYTHRHRWLHGLSATDGTTPLIYFSHHGRVRTAMEADGVCLASLENNRDYLELLCRDQTTCEVRMWCGSRFRAAIRADPRLFLALVCTRYVDLVEWIYFEETVIPEFAMHPSINDDDLWRILRLLCEHLGSPIELSELYSLELTMRLAIILVSHGHPIVNMDDIFRNHRPNWLFYYLRARRPCDISRIELKRQEEITDKLTLDFGVQRNRILELKEETDVEGRTPLYYWIQAMAEARRLRQHRVESTLSQAIRLVYGCEWQQKFVDKAQTRAGVYFSELLLIQALDKTNASQGDSSV
jgi:hypothetical protein